MSESVLAMYLDGPMQAWGYQSRFNRRTTLSYPTRSGVLGLVCAALGADRADRDVLAELEVLAMAVYALSVPARWTDYHTVGGGYDPDDLGQWSYIPRRATDGVPKRSKPTRNKCTVVTDREYLADAKFGVLLAGDERLLRRCEAALRNPVWGIWLGRKCCIPAAPVCQGLFSTQQEALKHLCSLPYGREGETKKVVRKIVEVDRFDEGSDTLMDRPVCFATREFLPRRVLNDPCAEE